MALASFTCVSSAWRACEGELRTDLKHRMSDGHAADDLLQDVFVKTSFAEGDGLGG